MAWGGSSTEGEVSDPVSSITGVRSTLPSAAAHAVQHDPAQRHADAVGSD